MKERTLRTVRNQPKMRKKKRKPKCKIIDQRFRKIKNRQAIKESKVPNRSIRKTNNLSTSRVL